MPKNYKLSGTRMRRICRRQKIQEQQDRDMEEAWKAYAEWQEKEGVKGGCYRIEVEREEDIPAALEAFFTMLLQENQPPEPTG